MKNPPIWESASRPLFVKSIWLDAGHRHFILDREPSQPANLRAKREPIRASMSCDFSPSDDEDLLLVGSSKAQCQQNLSATGDYRRFSSRKLFIDHFRKRYGMLRDDMPSKRSSLQDISSVMTSHSHSDEKLAERVLNWLDLAGKTPMFCPIQGPRQGEQKKSKKERSAQKKREVRQERKEPMTCSRRPDSVKHITIIFNKEGVPLRFNRPARNIDLCAVTSSAGAVRRLAGSLASARLYEDSLSAGAGEDCAAQRPKTSSGRKSMTTLEGSAKKMERQSSSDVKRQLHIFMPSLPKKPLGSEEAACGDVT